MHKKLSVRRLTISAMLIAVGMLLPFLTGQIQHIGNMLCPMHLPVFICGMVCGPLWGLAVGAILPVLRSAVFGMPVLMPAACAMRAAMPARSWTASNPSAAGSAFTPAWIRWNT